ncbi:hypothetical protein PR048_029797 [Dryococelus australis]|uniref:Ionotropic receptor n=1 Tax=Dryococelus australis TaxID=614101 RepID=A0ABQ9G749_9NEOP|nr:hypothetical protein PR048_029797 [Dryococelus australis]
MNIIPNNTGDYKDIHGRRAFVVFSEDNNYEFFIKSAAEIFMPDIWENLSFFILVSAAQLQGSATKLEDILRTYWTKLEVIHSIFIFTYSLDVPPSTANTTDVQIFSFNPFSNGGSFTQIPLQIAQMCTVIFDEMLHDAKGFPITAQIPELAPYVYKTLTHNGDITCDGPFCEVFQVIMERHNFTVERDIGEKITNLTLWSLPDSYGKIYDSYMYPDMLLIAEQLNRSTPLIIVVPTAERMPRWKNAILLSSSATWKAYLTLILLVIVLCRLITQAPQLESLEILRTLLVRTIFYKTKTNSLRLFLMSMSLFNIIFNNAYTGSFHSYRMVPQYYDEFNTINEFFKGEKKISIPSHMNETSCTILQC